jgi:ACS family hexuronate transporter-like MFS transporter
MKKRWIILLLLFLANIINYLDRSALSIVAPLVSAELELDPAELGIVFSSFFFGYALFNFIGGWASDKLGGKRVFGWSMGLWSFFCAGTAAATSFGSLLVARVLFGVGEGPLSSTINKIVNTWFPHRQAASAVGLVSSGTPLGGAIAGPVVGLLAVTFGWRVAFVAIGIIGFVWLIAWLLVARERPRDHPGITAAELAEIEDTSTAVVEDVERRPLRFYLKQPVVLATAFAFFGYNYILYFFLTWFPSYLTMAQGLSIQEMSIATVLPWVLGFFGLAVGGAVSDFVLRRTGRPLFARKVVLTTCLSIAAVSVILAGLVATVGSAVALMGSAVLFLYVSGSCFWAILHDTVQNQNIGGVGGFVHMIANCSGIIGPLVTGFLVQSTGAFTSAFILAGAVAVAGVLSVLIFVRPVRVETAQVIGALSAPAKRA